MSQPISFTVKPPTSAPCRPSPLGNNGGSSSRGAPSRRLFEQNGHDEDDDDEEDGYRGSSSKRSNRPRDERIDGFGNGKALGGDKPSGPLIIPALPNKDWRASATASASSSRTPSYRPETRDPNEKVEVHERTGDGPQRSGLRKKDDQTDYNDGYSTLHVKSEPLDDERDTQNGEVKMEPGLEDQVNNNERVKQEEEDVTDVKPQTLDEQALQAILAGEVKVESEEERLRRELIIGGPSGGHMTEEEAFKRDIDELPEESTIEDYAAIPVSAFGEAMARGMGWNPNSQGGTKIHEPKLRPALLGLGATALVEKPAPPSRNGSSKGKQQKVNKRDSMKYNLGESLIKKERLVEGSTSRLNTPTASSINGNGSGNSRLNSPDTDNGSTASQIKRRRDDDYDDERTRDRDRDSKRYETDEERARRKAKEREREGEYETEEERARRKAKERERRDRYDDDRNKSERYGGDRDRERDRDRDRDRRYRDDREDRRDRDRDGRDRYDSGRDRDRNRRDR